MNWGSVNWAVVVPIVISLAAFAVSIWTKRSEGRERRRAERARRSAELVATAAGATWEPATGGKYYDRNFAATYTIRLHNAGQMSAGDIVLWADLEGRRVSDDSQYPDLAPDARAESTVRVEHRTGKPLHLRARWTDGNGTHTRTLFDLDPTS